MSDTEVHYRVYPEEKKLLRKRAAIHGLSISEYLRRLPVQEERWTLKSKVHPQSAVDTKSGHSFSLRIQH